MKAIVLSKALDQDYDGDEIAVVRFEYLIADGPDAEVVEILMHKDAAEKYKLGAEVNLLK